MDHMEVEVRRSRRRTRTVQAYKEDGRVVVMVPARFSRAEEREWVDKMVAKLDRAERRRRPSDAALTARARRLSDTYLGGLARPHSVRWVDNMTTRWGSCTPSDASIRLSRRLQQMPPWVLDYVLVHELAHLLEANHNADFWAWVDAYPQAERAKGFLDGWCAAQQSGAASSQQSDEPGDAQETGGEAVTA
ncbi:M48 family metallopeptidase [Nocardioidaceae bacterium]|nr:M48 family metallopeptidase [Nocardioidaceae bacterium]